MSIVLVLAIIAVGLAVISLFPQAPSGTLTSLAVLLAGVALILIGYGGR